MDRNQHLNEVLNNKIRPLLEEAADVIDALEPGEKIPATELAKQVAERHGMTGPQFYPTLLFMVRDYPGVEVKRGAKGGIYKPLQPKD